MLPWMEPKSPGLFLSLCHRIALQGNELSSADVSTAVLPPLPASRHIQAVVPGGGEPRRVEISHRRPCWGQTCCKFYKENALQTRSPTLVCMELLINSLETWQAKEPILPLLSPVGLQQALKNWSPPCSFGFSPTGSLQCC